MLKAKTIVNDNMKRTKEVVEKIRAGVRDAWSNPSKFQTMRKQSPELIEKRISKLRGRSQPEHIKIAMSQRMRGRKLSEATKAKLRSAFPNGPVLTEEQKAKRSKSISEQRKGTHGFGRAARDRQDHHKANHWIIRDPLGQTYEFNNLHSWARANEWRFADDPLIPAKRPLWQRFVSGVHNMKRTDKKASHHWRGWTLVSVLELQNPAMPDLLNRQPISPIAP
jgi:hypothetical protein